MKHETYAEVLTTSTVLDRLKKAQEEKILKQVKVKTEKGENKKIKLKAVDKNRSKRPVKKFWYRDIGVLITAKQSLFVKKMTIILSQYLIF